MKRRGWLWSTDTTPSTPTRGFTPRGLPRVCESCERWLLAEVPFASVHVCSCRSVHLSISGYTVRLPMEALVPLRDLLVEATERLDAATHVARDVEH